MQNIYFLIQFFNLLVVIILDYLPPPPPIKTFVSALVTRALIYLGTSLPQLPIAFSMHRYFQGFTYPSHRPMYSIELQPVLLLDVQILSRFHLYLPQTTVYYRPTTSTSSRCTDTFKVSLIPTTDHSLSQNYNQYFFSMYR